MLVRNLGFSIKAVSATQSSFKAFANSNRLSTLKSTTPVVQQTNLVVKSRSVSGQANFSVISEFNQRNDYNNNNNQKQEFNYRNSEPLKGSATDIGLVIVPIAILYEYFVPDFDRTNPNKSWKEMVLFAMAEMQKENADFEKIKQQLNKAQANAEKIRDKKEKQIALLVVHAAWSYYYQVTAETEQQLKNSARHLEQSIQFYRDIRNTLGSDPKFDELLGIMLVHMARLHPVLSKEKAVQYANESIDWLTKVNGAKDPRTVTAKLNLASVLAFHKDFDKANSLFLEGIAQREASIPYDLDNADFPNLLIPLLGYSTSLSAQGKKTEAANYLSKKLNSIKLRDKSQNLVLALFTTRDMVQEEYNVLAVVDKFIIDVITKEKSKFPPELVNEINFRIGMSAAEAGNYETAITSFEQVRSVLVKDKSPDAQVHLAEVTAGLARAYEMRNKRGDIATADKLYVEAINLLGKYENPNTEMVVVLYIMFLENNGKKEKAAELKGQLSNDYLRVYSELTQSSNFEN